MTKNIVAILLVLFSAGLNFKHGWDAFQIPNAEQAQMMRDFGINRTIMPYFGVLSVVVGLMLFFPKTYLIGNIVNAVIILIIIALSLSIGNFKFVLIEIPFLLLPLMMIWLKCPFKF